MTKITQRKFLGLTALVLPAAIAASSISPISTTKAT
jgi:hypothetical protein